MYAVIKTGGKQLKVAAGDVIEVERLVTEGETVSFTPLLVVEDDGTVHAGSGAAKAVVTARPVGEEKGEKIRVFTYRPKTGYARRRGHRQIRTVLEVTEIALAPAPKRRTRAPAKDEAPAG